MFSGMFTFNQNATSLNFLGQSSFFKKYERKNLEFCTGNRESDFGNLYLRLIEKIGFPFFKKKVLIFKGQKYIFGSWFFSSSKVQVRQN